MSIFRIPMIAPFIKSCWVLLNLIINVKTGDLVRIYKHGAIGIVTEVFADLNPDDPWIRVLFTHPTQSYQWCKGTGLEVLKKEEGQQVPLLDAIANESGSL